MGADYTLDEWLSAYGENLSKCIRTQNRDLWRRFGRRLIDSADAIKAIEDVCDGALDPGLECDAIKRALGENDDTE